MSEPGGLTAFVSHSDCARHDAGWNAVDHQGRLPALVRAVYRDMLTLHGHLLEVEGVPASEADLRLLHTPRLIEEVCAAVTAAAVAGEPVAIPGGPTLSDASWDAALAAVGCAITGVDVVLDGRARNAFCAVRPAGADAGRDRVGLHSIFNSVALAARYAIERRGVERVLVVEWRGRHAPTSIPALFADDRSVEVVSFAPRAEMDGPAPATLDALLPAWFGLLDEALDRFTPQLMLLSAGFDGLVADETGALALQPADYHPLTRALRRRAERMCDGRLVSVLDAGYAARETGLAVVHHLRALAGLLHSAPSTYPQL